MPEISTTPPRVADIEAGFLTALPRIVTHARVAFRSVRCAHRREECVAEASALAWHWYRCLAARGKNPDAFISALARFAARQVRCGRRLCGQESGEDALSPPAQRRHGFATTSPGDGGCAALEALRDNTRSKPPAQAAFRIDFKAWLGSLTRRYRLTAEALLAGGRTADVALELGVSPGRVSQMRNELKRDWHRFHGECF